MPVRQFQLRPLLPVVLTAAALALLSWLALMGPDGRGTGLVRQSYDAALALRGPVAASAADSPRWPVALVYLDLRTFMQTGQDPSAPLDRRLHAQLVRRLTTAGARAVIFDILFEAPSADPSADAELADAFRANGRVFLGAEWHRSEHDRGDVATVWQRSEILPATNLLAAAAGHGFVFAKIDPDLVVREHFPGFTGRNLPSLTWATAHWLGLEATRGGRAEERWLNYYGPPFTIPNVSFSDALEPAAVPDEFFRDRIVIVGARPAAGQFDERRDEWRSPYSAWSPGLPFMPGVETHATEMLNLVRGDWLRRWPRGVELAVLVATAFGCAFGLSRLRPLPAAAATVGLELGLAGLVLAGMAQRLWFPWLIVALLQLPGALFASVLVQSVNWFRQRRRMLAKIREQAALIDKAQDAILVTDLAGRVTYLNPRARQLYGDAGPVADTSDDTLSVTDARRRVVERGDWSGELQQRARDGRDLTVESRWTLIRDDHGEPREILQINTDVTEQRRLQEQVLRAQRLEAAGALASGMAHDLNNALAPVLMGVQLLRRRTEADDLRRMLDVMETHARRGADMVKQVLLFSRGQAGDRQVLAVGELVREMERALRETLPAGIRLSAMLPEDLWPVLGQPTQLHQVLLNLCVNARDAMPTGGELSLAADNVELDAEEAARLSPEARPGRHVMVLVADTGAGMPPDIRARLFEPFFTTKPAGRGTGLGLATTALLVRQHGGFIVVKSEAGVGTEFEVYLPAAPVGAIAVPTGTSASAGGDRQLLLVASEDQSVGELLRQELTSLGYRVLVASSEAAARAALAPRRLAPAALIIAAPFAGTNALVGPALRPQLPVFLLTGNLPTPAGLPARIAVVTGPNQLQQLSAALAAPSFAAPAEPGS